MTHFKHQGASTPHSSHQLSWEKTPDRQQISSLTKTLRNRAQNQTSCTSMELNQNRQLVESLEKHYAERTGFLFNLSSCWSNYLAVLHGVPSQLALRYRCHGWISRRWRRWTEKREEGWTTWNHAVVEWDSRCTYSHYWPWCWAVDISETPTPQIRIEINRIFNAYN